MKGIPKTPVEFDYDLWTTEDGKCMVRIKATGEVTEVERTVMQVLRSEEKRFRRAMSLDQEADRDGIVAVLKSMREGGVITLAEYERAKRYYQKLTGSDLVIAD